MYVPEDEDEDEDEDADIEVEDDDVVERELKKLDAAGLGRSITMRNLGVLLILLR